MATQLPPRPQQPYRIYRTSSGGGPPSPWKRWALIGAIAFVAVATAVALVFLLTSGSSNGPKPAPSPPPAAISTEQVRTMLERYATAYSAEDVAGLERLFAPDFTRADRGGSAEGRAQALQTYGRQFGELTDPSYELSNVSISTSGQVAHATADYRISSAAGVSSGTISFDLKVVDGVLQFGRIETTPAAAPTPSPTPTPSPAPQPAPSPSEFARKASIHAWFTTWSGSYIHFKTVDEKSGKTVMEQPGSDNIELNNEQAAISRTAERLRLVNALRERMKAAGWTEIGTVGGGDWYEYRFGK